MHPVERRIGLGVVGPLVRAAALLPREAGGRDQPGEREGVVEQLAEPGRVALEARAAPERGARGLRRQRRRARLGRRTGRARGGRLGGGRDRGAPAVDEALGERVRREPVGAVEPAARALAHREEAREARAAVQVGRHAAHRVVGGGGHRDRLPRGVDAHLLQGGGDVGEAGHVDAPQVQADRALAAAAQLGLDREGHVVARRELVHEALAGRVEQRGPLAADRLGDEEAVTRAAGPQRRGVELHELEVGQPRARRFGEPEPGPDRPGRVGGALPERRHAAGGEDGCPREHRQLEAVAAAGEQADAAPLVRPEGHRRRGLEHLDALVGGRAGGQLAGDAPAGGRAARVHDAAHGVPALQPEREVAVPVGVEGHAQRLELVHPRRATPRRARGPRSAGRLRGPP